MTEYKRALSTMGDLGIHWIDVLFRWCVVLLVDAAEPCKKFIKIFPQSQFKI